MNIVFISYGWFENNSAYHIREFATRLSNLSHRVGFIAAGHFEGCKHNILTGTVDEVFSGNLDGRLSGLLADQSTIIHAWTPRETVRRLVEHFAARGLRYVVHLEDDERLVSAAHLNVRPHLLDTLSDNRLSELPGHTSHPRRAAQFLKRAAGITVITSDLIRGTPTGVPTLKLEPGVDTSFFKPALCSRQRQDKRRALGLSLKTILLTYHGNTHANNRRDMYSLYTAISCLRKKGVDVRLIRCGEPERSASYSTKYRIASGVLELGFVPRAEIPSLLDIADMYVQPDWATPFNVRRFPSKIPEFLAMGRPLLLPCVNIGHRLSDGVNAVILKEGGARAIIAGIKRVKDDDELAQTVGDGGRAFAIEHLDWDKKTMLLIEFYRSLHA